MVDIITRDGGLALNEENLKVRALQEDEDRVYWEIFGSKPLLQQLTLVPIKRKGLKRHAGISSHLRKGSSVLKMKRGSVISKKLKKKPDLLNRVRVNDLLDSLSQL